MKRLFLSAAAAALIGVSLNAVPQQPVQSLRGADAVDERSQPSPVKRLRTDNGPIARDFLQQPPLIPHKIEGYQVDLKFNKCLSCHSWSNYQKYGATKISQTHFQDRNGQVQANVSGGRYFCTQCHVPQVDAQPLVENIFQPVDALRQ